MSQQLSFIDGADLQAHARRSDPETSHAAAAKVDVAESHRLVLEALHVGPATSEAVLARLAGLITDSRCRGALAELERAGRVRVCGSKVNARGNRCRVYQAVGA